MISIDSEYKARSLQYLMILDATSFGFQEFLNVFDRDNITKIFKINKAWVSYYNYSKVYQLKIDW